MGEEIGVKEVDHGIPELPKPEVKIENIVATVILQNQLDLNLIETKIQDVDYNPDQFPGLVYRLESPRVTVLIFKSGKMVITGAKSVNQLIHVVKKLLKVFVEQGIPIQGKPQIQIQNIVASANLKVYIDLEKAALEFENSLYEPEQFPGLIYRMDEPRVVMLIFSSGKMVITGAKMEQEVYEAVKKVTQRLREAEAIIGIAE